MKDFTLLMLCFSIAIVGVITGISLFLAVFSFFAVAPSGNPYHLLIPLGFLFAAVVAKNILNLMVTSGKVTTPLVV